MPCYGLAVPLGLAFAEGIARGALSAAAEMPGVILRILRDPPTAAALRAWAPWAAPDGVIAYATRLPVPLRLVSVCTGGAPGVTVDEAAISRLAAGHLRDQAPACLAVVDAGAVWSRLRADAFLAACPQAIRLVEPDWERPAGRRRLLAHLRALPRPIGLFAGNDRTAAAIADAAAGDGDGLRPGRDLLLIGADDDDLACRSVHPHLSSVQVPWERVGCEALILLHRRGTGLVTVPPLGVAVRGSSDGLACGDAVLAQAAAAARAGADGVADLARAAGCSRRRLERRCRSLLGLAPLELLHRARLDRARALLAGGAGTAATARACGWTSRSAFAAAFRRATGETPGAWRACRR